MQSEAQVNVKRSADAPGPEVGNGSTDGQKLERFSVGYKKPPAQHRFKKGASGNPSGRPRKQGAADPVSPTEKQVERLMLVEAYREVSIREGDKVIKLPAIQAVMRSLGVAAMKGDRRAQLAFKEQTQAVEQKQHAEKMETFATYLKYKTVWTAEFKRCDEQGLKRPDLPFHPDDIKLDSNTCEVRILAPLDDYQKAQWDSMLEVKKQLIEAMVVQHRFGRRRPELSAETEEDIEAARQMIDVIDFCWPDEDTRRHPSFRRDDSKLPDTSKLVKFAKPSQRAALATIASRRLKAKGQ